MVKAAPSIPNVLEAVGIGRPEEDTYVALLDAPASTAGELAEHLGGHSPPKVEALLASLESRGFVSRLAGQPVRWQPAPPTVAVEVLVLQQREALERARLAALELQNRHELRPRSGVGEAVEVVLGQDAIRQRFVQLQMSAREEMLVFDKPPYVAAVGDAEPQEALQLRRGVTIRAIYDPSSLVGENADHLDRVTALGETARVASVPAKLAICDRRSAILPFRVDETGLDVAVLLHPSPLLDLVVDDFERLWLHAVPIGPGVPSEESPLAITPDTRRVLVLLAAGHNDKQIAQELGVTLRTVGRRIGRLQRATGAHSRFQLGLLAGQLGWLA